MTPANEPTAWSGAVTALAVAAIPLLRAFNVNVTQAQSDAVLGFLAALIVVATVFVRSKVTPIAEAQKKVDQAFIADPSLDPKPVL